MSHTAHELDEEVSLEDAEPKSRKKTIGIMLALFVGVVIVAVLIGYFVRTSSAQGPDPVAVTVPIALSEIAPPENAKIGVVLTLGEGTSEGSQWHQAAQGAVVAQQRLQLGGHDVELITEDDLGSETGSAEAVETLLEQGVSGIIYASSGTHLNEGLQAAETAGIPVILPYETAPDEALNVWSLKPGVKSATDVLAAEVGRFERPLHINAGADLPEGVTAADEMALSADTNVDDVAEELAYRTGATAHGNGAYTGGGEDDQTPTPVAENPADVVVISGPPSMQARAVYALQTGNVTVPVVLTDEALSPRFEQTLLELGGAVSSNFRTIGVPADDGVALGASGQSRAMSAFLSANRQFAGNESITNLTADAPLADTAASADVRGHDAVLAFASALEAAGDTGASNVAQALAELHLVAGHGIAGPALDFSQTYAVTQAPTVLHASSQRLGLRPSQGEVSDALVWIAQP